MTHCRAIRSVENLTSARQYRRLFARAEYQLGLLTHRRAERYGLKDAAFWFVTEKMDLEDYG